MRLQRAHIFLRPGLYNATQYSLSHVLVLQLNAAHIITGRGENKAGGVEGRKYSSSAARSGLARARPPRPRSAGLQVLPFRRRFVARTCVAAEAGEPAHKPL